MIIWEVVWPEAFGLPAPCRAIPALGPPQQDKTFAQAHGHRARCPSATNFHSLSNVLIDAIKNLLQADHPPRLRFHSAPPLIALSDVQLRTLPTRPSGRQSSMEFSIVWDGWVAANTREHTRGTHFVSRPIHGNFIGARVWVERIAQPIPDDVGRKPTSQIMNLGKSVLHKSIRTLTEPSAAIARDTAGDG